MIDKIVKPQNYEMATSHRSWSFTVTLAAL